MKFPEIVGSDQWFLVAASALWLLMAWYYLRWFTAAGSRKYLKREQQRASAQMPVSIIVCAHNEAKNLRNNIPVLLSQDYPQFELIVVDDGSWDDTPAYLRTVSAEFPRVKLCTIDRDRVKNPGKKLAITLGIKAASHEHLLLIDADCTPASPQWLKKMASAFMQNHSLVIGFSPYRKRSGLLNLFIRFETLITGMQYLSMALKGRAYMGVGRNLGYTKTQFFQVKGFASNHHLPAGDDDLFVQDAARPGNTAVVLDQEAHTFTDAKTSIRAWWKQKKRHLFVGKHYKPAVKRFLGLLSFIQLTFYVMLPIWFVCAGIWWLPLAFWGLWLLLRFIVVARTASLLGQMNFLWLFTLLDISYVYLLTVAGLNAWFAKRIRW
jgi:glycosyltransferase involved in cell wall biosynthesis